MTKEEKLKEHVLKTKKNAVKALLDWFNSKHFEDALRNYIKRCVEKNLEDEIIDLIGPVNGATSSNEESPIEEEVAWSFYADYLNAKETWKTYLKEKSNT